MKAFVEGKIEIGLVTPKEAEVEEFVIHDESIKKKAKKLAQLLKKNVDSH